MIESILLFLRGLPPELATVLIAMLPIVEVRGAVPIALEVFKLPIGMSMFLAFVGSVIPAMVLPQLLQGVEGPLRRFSAPVDRLFVWMVQHVEARYTERYRAMGALGLLVFIAIPLPVTGVWTGSLAAWVFRMPSRYAIPAILAGTAISTGIVTLTAVSGFAALRAIL